jgi:hypothetical protein
METIFGGHLFKYRIEFMPYRQGSKLGADGHLQRAYDRSKG